MASIKKRISVNCYGVLILLIQLAAPLFSQDKPILLSAEIASIEKKISDSKLNPAERKNALETMARLFELSGNAEAAAEAWRGAALTVSGNTDHGDLLQSARCLAAIGEFDKADTVLKPVLSISGNRVLQNRARILAAQLEALRTGNTAMLNGLLSNPDFAAQRPALYYSVWRISADPSVQSAMASRLLAEFPQSPEARIIRNDIMVNAAPAALWLLLGVEQAPPAGPAAVNSPGSTPQPSVVSPSGSVPPSAVSPPGSRSDTSVMLQTGLFSLEENARSLANRLQNAGFNSVIAKKNINGKDHWTVGVPSGPDLSRTMLLLKDKGFESFPVYQ